MPTLRDVYDQILSQYPRRDYLMLIDFVDFADKSFSPQRRILFPGSVNFITQISRYSRYTYEHQIMGVNLGLELLLLNHLLLNIPATSSVMDIKWICIWCHMASAVVTKLWWTNWHLYCSYILAGVGRDAETVVRTNSDPVSRGRCVCGAITCSGGNGIDDDHERKWEVLRHWLLTSSRN